MKPEEIHNETILFSPLNWGMGHVSRSIPLLQKLQENNKLFIACDKDQRAVYNEYLSEVEFINHDGYPFKFKGKGKFTTDLIWSGKKLMKRLKEEREEVERYVNDFNISLIISDHRYGFRNDKVRSIFVTHQLNLPIKWYHKSIQKWHSKLISKFDWVWIVDDEVLNLAGKLSKKSKDNQSYIGLLSRFENTPSREKDLECVLIASGPEIYAKQLIDEVEKREGNVIVISSNGIKEQNFKEFRIAGWKDRDVYILRAKKIISRSGYSTLMDLHFLGCESELIPTPGQHEQVYLKEKREAQK